MSASLSSSLDMLSLSHTTSTRWANDSTSDDEDEIVWSLSSSAVLSSSSPSPLISPLSETADLVLVPRIEASAPNVPATAAAAATTTTATATATNQEPVAPASPPSALTPDGIAQDMAALSLSTAVPGTSQPRYDNDDAQQALTTTSATAPAPAMKKACASASSANNNNNGGASTGPPSAAAAAAATTRTQTQTLHRTPTPKPKPTKAKKQASLSSSSSSSGSVSAAVVAPPPPPPPRSVSSSSSSSSSSAPKKKSKGRRRRATKKGASASASTRAPPPPAPPARERQTGSELGLGLRAVVDDSSVSEVSEDEISSTAGAATDGYSEAQEFMTTYLAHPPPPGNNGSALLMLQALILELGCLPDDGGAAGRSHQRRKFSIPELPGTMRQAKLLLKSRAFINVRDYLAVRDQGQAALRSVMHPSRNSLVREVRKRKRVPVREVKEAGLKVLLVNTHF